jgi:hypothetical protein
MMGLSFTISDGGRQRSHSHVRVPRDSWLHFTVSDSRLPQQGGPGPRIYIPQEQGGPVILPGTRFPFRRLLRLAGLRWRYSTPPLHLCLSLSLSLSLMLRPTVSRPVCLGIKSTHLGLTTRFLLLSVSCGFVDVGLFFLTRGRVCHLQFLLALASAVILVSEPCGNCDHILLSQIRDLPFRRLLRLAGLRWR